MGERKKVAILLPWLKMGGTNMVALRFARELSQFCHVTLILSQCSGELLDSLPENIQLLVDKMRPFQELFWEDLKHCRLHRLVQDVVYYAKIKCNRDSVDNYRYLVRRQDRICDTEFDCAISYHGQSPERLLNLLYRIRAKKKMAWIHGEFHNSQDHYRRMNAYYGQMDGIFFVSVPTMESFLETFTYDRSRCTVYYNPLDRREIWDKARAECEPPLSDAYVNLLTVGRFSKEKGQDLVPAIVKRLQDAGHRVRWYLIGDGDTRPAVERAIAEYGVKEAVVLLGTRKNPYCFMRACDIYVQPSYTEGYSTTICEAGLLGKAIVGTKPSGGIRDQICHGEDGLIVDASVDGLTEGILRLIENAPLRKRFESTIPHKNWEGTGEMQKFLSFLDDEGTSL